MSWKISAGFLIGAMTGALGRRPAMVSAASPPSSSAPGEAVDAPTKAVVVQLTDAEMERLRYNKAWGIPWVEDWDHVNTKGTATGKDLDKEASKVQRRRQRQLLLIRHGQYQNESSSDDAIRTLTPLGIQQAKATGKYLAGCFEHASPLFAAKEPKRFVASDLTRAKETANFILSEMISAGGGAMRRPPLEIDSLLREKYPCDPSPAHSIRASTSHMKLTEQAFAKYFHRPLVGGKAADAADSVEVLVCHANVIRYLVLRAAQLPPEAWLRFSLPHCSITSVTIMGNGHVKVHSIGSYSHLSPDMHTTRNIS